MKVLVTGACGFVGASLIHAFREAGCNWTITGFDNLVRRGGELNRAELQRLGVPCVHGDLRAASDLDSLDAADWVIDAAAHASVTAGVVGGVSSRQLMEHNLFGTVHLLERCRAWRAGLILLSTSRVYSIAPLRTLPLDEFAGAFQLRAGAGLPPGMGAAGITEAFSSVPPISLYGATKLAAELLTAEYSEAFGFPAWINRCGVMAGARQFGRPDQGIFGFWLHMHRARRPLRYVGFGGTGHQVRDCLHPRDLAELLMKQVSRGHQPGAVRVVNVSGGLSSAISLRQLTSWCNARFGAHPVSSDPEPRAFDLPWVVLDSGLASRLWDWRPKTKLTDVLEEIAAHAEANPDWLRMCGV